MTMDAYVLCDRPIRSISEWQTAIDELGFGLTLRTPERDLETAYGHLSARWRGREAGFECGLTPISELIEAFPQLASRGPWACAYAFHFATLPACVGVWFAVAACIKLAGGIAFDPQDDLIFTADQAARYAIDTESQALALDAR